MSTSSKYPHISAISKIHNNTNSDTRGFVARRWETVCKLCRSELSEHDRHLIDRWPDFQSVREDWKKKYRMASTISQQLKFDEALQFLSTYRQFDYNFIEAMKRPNMETSLIFGALGLVIEVSEPSSYEPC